MKTKLLSYTDKEAMAEFIKAIAFPLNHAQDLDPLMERVGDASVVMLGEASHGTHEYYIWRSAITKRLIEEKGFSFVAVEGDWPDAYRLNRYIKNYTDSGYSAEEVLRAFNRWPTWMWANWEIVALAEWMRKHNERIPLSRKTGFYGLDVYSLWESLEVLQTYLKEKDLSAWKLAKNVVACFEPYKESEGQGYARATTMEDISCEEAVINLLAEIRRRMPLYNTDPDAVFNAEQNAVVIANAEKYYRAMMRGGALSWNIRDQHMFLTLQRLMNFHGHSAKAIVWEHNTHIGDARATDMREDGMFNIGELARKEIGTEDVVLVGFGSYQGKVTAAARWSAGMRQMELPPAISGSWEEILHSAEIRRMLLLSDDIKEIYPDNEPIKHRAVGVVYNPEAERMGNYVPSIIPRRYDAFIYIDETRGLHPLHITPDGGQMPETYPWGV